MRILFLLVFISLTAAIFAYLSKIVEDNVDDRKEVYSLIDKTKSVPDGSNTNLFWFVQVSDIHVSRFYDFDRAPNLVKFCESQLTVIKPDFVIASGDLTDAKHKDKRGSQQYSDEWKTYHDIITRCRKVVNTWLDLRGNHDAFNIPDVDDERNMFRKYSSQGGDHPTSYVYHHRKAFGRYSFVGVDATPNPGPRRPFNFFGYVKQDGERLLYRLINESRGSNVTLAFGHYPSSLVATETGNSLRNILRNVTAYLCGHLHTLGGLVPRMYARHFTGSLELELGDWKDARIYRIVALDHDIMSITDERFGKWPVVMVTNPKEASLLAPYHEPIDRMRNSTHIRILVFSDGSINNVEVHIDDVHIGKALQSEGPLYVLPWKPSAFSTGLHSIKVTVQDSVNGRHIHQQVFSLDGSSPPLPLRSRLILKLDVATLAHFIFYSVTFLYVCVLVLLRHCNNIRLHYIRSQAPFLRQLAQWYNSWLYCMWVLTKASSIYYTLQLFVLYIAFGPWFLAELIDGHHGLVFVWGMYVMGQYLPAMLTYVYGLFQVLVVNIPLTFYLAYRLQYSQLSPTRRSAWHAARHIHFPFLAFLALVTYVAVTEFPSAYGTTAFVVGPVRTGSVVITLALQYIARKTDVSTLVACRTD